jgi:hypothetical protein
MSRTIDLSPNPKSHIKTLMRIGYDMPSAVADILDNSITAESGRIEIYAPPGLEDPLISIIDDGYGMTPDALVANMRIGCKDPNDARGAGDLGRFGSGMKTASFSQARKLTVISKTATSPLCAAIWDIDRIENENSWCLEILEGDEVKNIHELKLDHNVEQGTQIIWEKLSCISTGDHARDHDEELASVLVDIQKKVALHFHRFLQGKNKKMILINGALVKPIDPFMTKANGYQEGRSERLRCKGGHIEIKTHVLPYFKKMTVSEMEDLDGADGILQNQGLYIYREGRLIIAGGWLGLAKNSQLGALARVQVDVPSSLDHEWSTDVKKSSLQIPSKVKRELRKFLSDPIKRSKKVYAYRGTQDKANKYWNVVEDENKGTITYQIDTENKELLALLKVAEPEARVMLIRYLTEISSNLPINHIYQKMSESPKEIDQESLDSSIFKSTLSKIF